MIERIFKKNNILNVENLSFMRKKLGPPPLDFKRPPLEII